MKNVKLIATTKYNADGYYLEWFTGFNTALMAVKRELHIPIRELKNDIQIVLYSPKKVCLGDAISHFGSYGVEKDLWEVMMLDVLPDVKGFLPWKEIAFYFDEQIEKEEKKNA